MRSAHWSKCTCWDASRTHRRTSADRSARYTGCLQVKSSSRDNSTNETGIRTHLVLAERRGGPSVGPVPRDPPRPARNAPLGSRPQPRARPRRRSPETLRGKGPASAALSWLPFSLAMLCLCLSVCGVFFCCSHRSLIEPLHPPQTLPLPLSGGFRPN